MKLENSFEVPVPAEEAWDLLLDVERIVPCMPGAELTDVVDETTWKGKVTVKLGAVSLAYKGTVNVAERDEDRLRVVLEAKAMETRGKGTAAATVTSRLERLAVDRTQVHIETDLRLSGQAAQMGRGMIGDVSHRMTDEFAGCIHQHLETTSVEEGTDDGAADAGTAEEGADAGDRPAGDAAATGRDAAPSRRPVARSAQPVGGLRLGIWALWRAFLRTVLRTLRWMSGRIERRLDS